MSNTAIGLLTLLAAAVTAVAYLLLINAIAEIEAPRPRWPQRND
jgi:hypothetical protein